MFQHDKTNVALFIHFLLKRIPCLKRIKCSQCNKLFTLLVCFSHHNLKPLPQVPICSICFQHSDKTRLSFFFLLFIGATAHNSPGLLNSLPPDIPILWLVNSFLLHSAATMSHFWCFLPISAVILPQGIFHGIFHPLSFLVF